VKEYIAMQCCQCQAAEHLFNERMARADLRHYRRRGPSKTTQLLVRALEAQGIEGLSLLDIGGGIGAIQHALLAAGASRATDVDASSAYLAAAREESERLGHGDRATYLHGNFADMEANVPPADIVTLERVICCYSDMPALVGASAAKAQRFYGLVYPRDAWWTRLGGRVINGIQWLRRDAFRFFVHPNAAVDAAVRGRGLARQYHALAGPWQVVLYERTAATS
jgi:magnesium-protoporphyrin O-methyltransferase